MSFNEMNTNFERLKAEGGRLKSGQAPMGKEDSAPYGTSSFRLHNSSFPTGIVAAKTAEYIAESVEFDTGDS